MGSNVVKVERMRSGMSGSKSFKHRDYVEKYRVEFDGFDDIIRLAQFADDGVVEVPDLGDAYSTDAYAFCETKSGEQIEDEPIIIVTCVFRTPEGKTKKENPTDEAASIKWGFAAVNKVVEKDVVTGKPIVSSAGEILVPGIEQDDYNLTLTVVRNQTSFNALTARGFIGRINNADVTIAGISWGTKEVLCTDYSASREERNGYTYYAVTYSFEFSRTDWIREILDQGTYYLDADGNKQICRDGGEKSPVTKNLDGSGHLLIDGQPAVFLDFETRYLANFSLLNLGAV